MPIVFVHGVAVREGPQYKRLASLRDGFFRATFAPPDARDRLVVLNPYWGGQAANFRWGMRSLPSHPLEPFGSDDLELRVMLSETVHLDSAGQDVLLRAVRDSSPSSAIDALWLSSAYAAEPKDCVAFALAGNDALGLLEDQEVRTTTAKMRRDSELVNYLAVKLRAPDGSTETFGSTNFFETLSVGLAKLGQSITNVPVSALRPKLNEMVTRFVGDVFTYINERGDPRDPGPIVRIVMADIQAAASRSGPKDPLVIVAHSMGGNIAYDILTSFLPDVYCHLFLTVGSQVSLFEEMKLFRASDRSIPNETTPQVAKPRNIGKWINVLDRVDILSYVMAPVFSGVTDFDFLSNWSPLAAHGSYFYGPSFYQRLRHRVPDIA